MELVWGFFGLGWGFFLFGFFFFEVGIGERRWGLFVMKADSMRNILAFFVPFLKGIFSFISVPCPLLCALLHVDSFFKSIKNASSGLCGVFEETLCECLLTD